MGEGEFLAILFLHHLISHFYIFFLEFRFFQRLSRSCLWWHFCVKNWNFSQLSENFWIPWIACTLNIWISSLIFTLGQLWMWIFFFIVVLFAHFASDFCVYTFLFFYWMLTFEEYYLCHLLFNYFPSQNIILCISYLVPVLNFCHNINFFKNNFLPLLFSK